VFGNGTVCTIASSLNTETTEKKRGKGMLFLQIFLGILAAAFIYMYIEAALVEVTHVRFSKGKNGLKILQISDIHINMLRVSAEKVASVIERENPDMVVMTGDYIQRPSDIPHFLDFIDKINSRHHIYACLGNHDYLAFLKDKAGLEVFLHQLEEHRVTVLENKSVAFEKGGRTYELLGIGDIRYKADDIEKALNSADNLIPRGNNRHKGSHTVKIALAHNPDAVLKFPRGAVDYLLCGHFHGGQIWAPFDFEFRILRDEKLCRMGIKRGLHKVNNINLYINRGLGNVCVPLRFMSRPEITIFHIP